jgi:hypothetical protein
MRGALYDWSGVPGPVRGEPVAPPPLTAVARVTIAGASVELTREVTFRIRDEASGEVRHPLRVVPPVEVSVEPELIVWPTERGGSRSVTVTVTSNSSGPVHGTITGRRPAGMAGTRLRFVLAVPERGPGRRRRRAGGAEGRQSGEILRGRRGRPLGRSADLHGDPDDRLRAHPSDAVPPRSGGRAHRARLKLPTATSVGYVRGAADRMPEALSGVGLPVRVLSAGELERGDLARFDAIVIGPRAYETEPALARANARLLDYARSGGLLVVQYQQYPFIQGGFAPYKLEIARPHDRVTDETARVTVLDPRHPIFTTPNPIVESDWQGWVQERGLYFAHAWDAAYTPLLEMADPGEPAQRGSLLVATIGKGRYVYTGLAFFRQLPAGVPGAYRLFANLIAWKAGQPAR